MVCLNPGEWALRTTTSIIESSCSQEAVRVTDQVGSEAKRIWQKPESWNMTLLQRQSLGRRKSRINRPRPIFQLVGVYCIAPCCWTHVSSLPKAPCSFIVHTWALKGLPYHNFGVQVYTVKLHGAFGAALMDGNFFLAKCTAAAASVGCDSKPVRQDKTPQGVQVITEGVRLLVPSTVAHRPEELPIQFWGEFEAYIFLLLSC